MRIIRPQNRFTILLCTISRIIIWLKVSLPIAVFYPRERRFCCTGYPRSSTHQYILTSVNWIPKLTPTLLTHNRPIQRNLVLCLANQYTNRNIPFRIRVSIRKTPTPFLLAIIRNFTPLTGRANHIFIILRSRKICMTIHSQQCPVNLTTLNTVINLFHRLHLMVTIFQIMYPCTIEMKTLDGRST